MSCRGSRSEAGFTLIEVLVAIAILALVLGAIGAVVGTTVKAIRSVDRRLPLLETARSLMAALPGREALQPGTQTGRSGEYRWRIDAVPLADPAPDIFAADAQTPPPKWMPLAITVQVQDSAGPPVRLDTVRLVPRPQR